MSHELRTPMNAILGFGQLLQSAPPGTIAERQPEFVGHIVSAGQHLLLLIDEVLDLARIDSGRLQLFMEAVDPLSVVEECINLVQSTATQRQVTLDNRLQADSGPRLWADKARLQQALLNLLSNAIKYNHVGGQVTIESRPLANGVLRLSIIDNGPGIAPEHMSDLFQPFERLGAEFGGVEGTGIGLTITKRLVEMMGGELGVASEEGRGTTFWVDLPTGGGEAAVAPVDQDLPAQVLNEAPYRALYIEDDPASLQLMRAIFERQQKSALVDALNAEFGLELARSRHPDVIFMDINLPGMDGYEALKILKADATTQDIPVIAISAGAMQKDIERGLAAGFSDYLVKPLDLNHFQTALDNALNTTVAG